MDFKAVIISVKSWIIIRLPDETSKQLPSRGQVAVTGTINDVDFRTVLEPDGNFGHWIHINAALAKTIGISTGDTVSVRLEVTKQWPEPEMPDDFTQAMHAAPDTVKKKWHDITPMARWEWIRWINATARDETRTIRIEKSISKLAGKHRRPCCFNLAACTVPEVSKNGVLMTQTDSE